MKKVICGFVILTALLSSGIFAQRSTLPRIKKGESYSSVRLKMLKAGWSPYHAHDADTCMDGDSRCQGRPEMQACAGTGMANCAFTWKRKGKTVTIFTTGEDTSYSGYRF